MSSDDTVSFLTREPEQVPDVSAKAETEATVEPKKAPAKKPASTDKYKPFSW